MGKNPFAKFEKSKADKDKGGKESSKKDKKEDKKNLPPWLVKKKKK